MELETFTHRKGVLARSTHLDLPVRYPPYTTATDDAEVID